MKVFGPTLNDWYPYKYRRGHRKTEREGHVKTVAVKVMQPQAKEHWEPLEAGKGQEGFSPWTFEGNVAQLHLNQICGPQSTREYISILLRHPVFGN